MSAFARFVGGLLTIFSRRRMVAYLSLAVMALLLLVWLLLDLPSPLSFLEDLQQQKDMLRQGLAPPAAAAAAAEPVLHNRR